ncbi:MAG: GNAT family N-acetyltransferase [Nostocaceae cyanobacterium]|nr:GNAT family N-acetyltransferase [Nostocaceae cyanobacterium]
MSDLVIKLADLPTDLPAIQAIRRTVFQEEQKVAPDLDFDGQDEACEQIIAYLNQQAVGTARVRYLDEKTAKIERLAVLPIARGYGLGKKIMTKALDTIAEKKIAHVIIHAQEYIKGLYQQLGFEEVGDRFEDAGITHVKMSKNL